MTVSEHPSIGPWLIRHDGEVQLIVPIKDGDKGAVLRFNLSQKAVARLAAEAVAALCEQIEARPVRQPHDIVGVSHGTPAQAIDK